MPVELHALGSVRDVMAGLPPAHRDGVSMQGTLAGFLAGSPRDVESIGEFIGFHGVTYARSTGIGADYGALIHGNRLVSNGAVLLREGAVREMAFEVKQPASIAELCEEFERQVGGPVCFVGTAVFDVYHVTAIGYAPVHREPIFEHSSTYYPRPASYREGGVPAALMGCAAALTEVSGGLGDELQTVLYVNPAEPAARITGHTHALELRRPVRSVGDVTPALAVNVDHVFGDSVIRTGLFDLYRVSRVVQLRD